MSDFVRGDPAGFELLVRRHADVLYRFAYRMTGDAVVAEDVVQEAFLQVSLSADGFDTSRRFRPWLFTITANKARDRMRRQRRRREVPLEVSSLDARWRPSLSDTLAAEVDHPHRSMDASECRVTVRTIIEQMPPVRREMLLLAYYHRFTYRQIADIVGIPLGTVKSRLHAAGAHFARQYRAAASESAARRRAPGRSSDVPRRARRADDHGGA